MNTDPVADMLTRIRNANQAGHEDLLVPASKLKVELAKLLQSEGYICGYEMVQGDKYNCIKITLKYRENRQPVLSGLKRVSKPGLRIYSKASKMPKVYDGLGIAVVSTSKGLLTDRKARKENIGGEVLCYVW